MPGTFPPSGGMDGSALRRTVSRRRFLGRFGALVGVGTLAPLLRALDAPRRPVNLEASRPALGSWMRVVARDPDPALAKRAIESAFAAVRRVDAQMSVHRSDSQLSRINEAAGVRPVAVDADVIDVIERAARATEVSRGAYDATILPLMRLYGFYGEKRADMPSDLEISRTLAATGSRHVVMDRAAGTVALARRGAGLDLGSIGKGWAVDRAVAAMRAEGIASGLVDLGGNVYGIGTPEDGAAGWSIGLFHPASGQLEHVFTLRDASVATSGNSEQTRTLGEVCIGHLFDARRGRPSDGHVSASVVAASGMDADVLSTVAFLVGRAGIADQAGVLETRFVG